MSTLLVHSDSYANWIFSQSHPTQGRRFLNARELLLAEIQGRGLQLTEVAPRPATRSELARIHSEGYISEVLDDHRTSQWDGDRPDLADLAALFAGGTLTALDALIKGDTRLAINFPGAKHHAQYDHSSGFCIFADFALAADIATKDHGLKVAIIDIDGHHGDGSENLTADNADVITCSIHGSGIFPGTGNSSDLSRGIYNYPLDHKTGLGDAALIASLSDFIPQAKAFAPDLIFIAAGADGLADDPLTHLQYSVEGYRSAAALIAQSFPNCPILLGGAGGYLPDSGTPLVWATVAAELSAHHIREKAVA